MKLSHLFALCTVLTASMCAAQQPKTFYLKKGDSVVFYGDSITEQRMYSAIVEAFVATRYPNLNVYFTNSGWGGDTVYGGGGGSIDSRLNRDVLPFHPSVVTIMLGMNDGGYHPANDATNEKYYTGYRHIVEALRAGLPDVRITAIEPSPYDDVTHPHSDFEYNEVLRGYGMWIGNYAEQAHIDTADMNTDFVKMLHTAYELNPETAGEIIPGRIHPSFAGHLIMAEELLRAWNARPLVSAVTIDASKSAAKVESATDATVTGLANSDSLSWTELDNALPLPFRQWQNMWGGGPAVTLAIKSSDITDALNQQILKVKGLRPGTYSIKVDGNSIGVFNRDQLAAGVNLALLKTPATDQAMKVYQLAVSQEEIHFDWWRNIEVPLADDGFPQSTSAIDALRALETAIQKKVYETAQPTPHHFEIDLVQ